MQNSKGALHLGENSRYCAAIGLANLLGKAGVDKCGCAVKT